MPFKAVRYVFVGLSFVLMGWSLLTKAPKSVFKGTTRMVYRHRVQCFQPSDTPKVNLPYPIPKTSAPFSLPFKESKWYLNAPSNFSTTILYVPAMQRYQFGTTAGSLHLSAPDYLTKPEYQNYQYRKLMLEYWKSKVSADELSQQPRPGMIPKLQVNSELFERIFGSNVVEIKPNGVAEIIFGLNRNVNRNPSVPQNQQKLTNFDFNMRIQMNLAGKIGEKLKINANYNTDATFEWENQVKIDFAGLEDDIIKKIEAGNVTLPLNSSLISGSQTLFGIKTDLQFGKLRATTVLSQQKGKKQEITIQGGAQVQNFNISADQYEQNKHFFISHYFRSYYDIWMQSLPVVNTPIVITKMEVYVLGINGSAEQTRNIVAFEDLGEDTSFVWPGLKRGLSDGAYIISDARPDSLPSNTSNSLYQILTNPTNGLLRDRKIDDVSEQLSTSKWVSNPNNAGGIYMDASRDYNIIRNARRLTANEFVFNPRTGCISLNQQLNNDQALGISFQFTYGGRTFQVGEFSEQVPDNTKLLVCKLLKSTVVNVKQPVWDLMMKNVYAIGAYNLNPQDFKLDVFYNNIETGVDVPYLPAGSVSGKVNGKQLIRVLQADRLSVNGDKLPDGVYDFINGYTVQQNTGRIYFPTAEPFGKSLAAAFEAADFPDVNKYIFYELYDSTRTAASFIQNKNRFKLKGQFRTSSGSEISLNAMNIPQGAVVVSANGVNLTENTDYTIDYTLGRVKIINEGILNSGATIKISLESNSLFSVQQKSLLGSRFDYKASRYLNLGGTFLKFTERPLTQKVAFGEEPASNFILGLDYNYKADAPFITRWLDKLPFFSTKEMSSITSRGEIAKLFAGNAKAISTNGGNSYIDDFEGSISLIDVKGATAWNLSSIPQGQAQLFPEAAESNTTIPGLNRAKLCWYNVDPMFTREQATTPDYYTGRKLYSNNMWRQVFETELFPSKIPPNGQQQILQTLDLLFYPQLRGPYNYDVLPKTGYSKGVDNEGLLNNPESRWAGISRRLETNDFQSANVEYIQFWLMDPYNEDYKSSTDSMFDATSLPAGQMYINLGNISEDIIKDGRMVYENGLPGPSDYSKNLKIDTTVLANVPLIPPVINAFSLDNADRTAQDVGYDGLSNDAERKRFSAMLSDARGSNFNQASPFIKSFLNDPSSDDYHFFRGDDYDAALFNTVKRYKYYNNPEGNSPTEAQYGALNPKGGNYPTGSTTLPNIEDINRDNTLSESENYYQYRISISPNDVNAAAVGRNFIVDAFNGTATFGSETKTVKWYQFKIPVSQFEKNVGGLEGFNSIRFMRVFLKGFERPVMLRMARFELVRSDWRRYQYDLKQSGEYLSGDAQNTSFDVSAVSLQENGKKVPVNYVMPPNIQQQQNVQTTNLVLLNEQALQMRICGLEDGDSRAIFKNVDFDTRMFNNIKMDVHAEALNAQTLADGDLNLFFRIGSDYNSNFYEYEIPLVITPKGIYDANSDGDRRNVWPESNQINLKFSDISILKELRNQSIGYFSNLNQVSVPFTKSFGTYSVTIVGNPNLGNVKSIMVGVRNRKTPDRLSHCAEIWINELRLTDFNNQGGWAATGQVQTKLADVGNMALSGTYKSPFWGGVESKINDRTKESTVDWDMSTALNMGKFLPEALKITLPIYYNFGQTRITPLFNPLDPDVRMQDLNQISDAALQQDILNRVLDITERKGFNVSNVKIEGLKRKVAKPAFYDISNFTATYVYNEISKRNVTIEQSINRQLRLNVQYAYAIKSPLSITPFQNLKFLKAKSLALIKDFNIQLTPNNFGFSTDINRTYVLLKNRDNTSLYADTLGFSNPALINKNFIMTRNYNLLWNLSKSLKWDYTATNESRILELPGEWVSGSVSQNDYIWNTFKNGRDSVLADGSVTTMGQFGENTQFRQQHNLNWDVPINKIPVLIFIKISYRYGGTYTWNRKPFAADLQIGNTIQNTNTQNITANLNFVSFYSRIPFLNKLLNPTAGAPRTVQALARGDAKKREMTLGDTLKPKKDNPFKAILQFAGQTLLMFKNASLTYQLTGGQALPNFKPRSRAAGLDTDNDLAPGIKFVGGIYDPDFLKTSINNRWISTNAVQTTPYLENAGRTLNYRASVEPHKSLRIDFNGVYTLNKSKSSYIVYDSTQLNTNGYRTNISPVETGNFNISTLMLGRSFRENADALTSILFDDFLRERDNAAKMLSAKNKYSKGSVIIPGTGKAYYDGYSVNQQDVLLYAFYKAYTGRDIESYSTQSIFPKLPLPGWTLNFDGLGQLPVIQKHFRGISVRHGYRSTYSISSFNNDLLFNSDSALQNRRYQVSVISGSTELNPNFISYYNINTVVFSENFEPLIRFDFQFKDPKWTFNTEMKRNKTIALNPKSIQIIETRGQEFVVGFGYKHPKLKIGKLMVLGRPLESPLTTRLDLSYRKNITVIRDISTANSMPSAGTNIWSVRSSADYQITDMITLRLFYDWTSNTPQTSAAFPTANANGGFSLRINFQ